MATGAFDWSQAKTRKRNASRQIPLWADFLAFDGHHCRQIYSSLSEDWRCPGCGRSTFEVLRWTTRFPNKPKAFQGWVGGYHRHHDHGAEQYRFSRSGPLPRFPETVVCEQCNSADKQAKRQLLLPAVFSFAPAEIREFVEPAAHGWHLLNFQIAAQIYLGVSGCMPGVWPPMTDNQLNE